MRVRLCDASAALLAHLQRVSLHHRIAQCGKSMCESTPDVILRKDAYPIAFGIEHCKRRIP